MTYLLRDNILRCIFNGIEINEEWKSINDFEDRFEVSNFGRIKSINGRNNKGAPIIIKQYIEKNGYARVTIRKRNNKQKYKFSVHRLVGEYFIENPNSLPVINHIDNDPLNNNYKNLEWCTQLENLNHAKRQERLNIKGERHYNTSLTELDVLKIRETYSLGKISQLELGKKFGVGRCCIKSIVSRQSWAHI